jgi:hypothetical protein
MARTAWPTKAQREGYEIRSFIYHYARLPHARRLEVLERREKPDFFVRDPSTGQQFGVELTSVYLSDRSVPDEHIPPIPSHLTTVRIPHNETEVAEYKKRLVEAVSQKIVKAKTGYDLRYPLLLSVYVNEYRAIYLDTLEHWEDFVRENEAVFDGCSPFSEIVFWSLPNDLVFGVRPEPGV